MLFVVGDFMGGAQPCADFLFGKKMCGKRWGLLFSAFLTRKIFQAADRRGYALEKAGCQSPKNFPTNKIFLPQIPRLGAGVFHPFNSLRPAPLHLFFDYYKRR